MFNTIITNYSTPMGKFVLTSKDIISLCYCNLEQVLMQLVPKILLINGVIPQELQITLSWEDYLKILENNNNGIGYGDTIISLVSSFLLKIGIT